MPTAPKQPASEAEIAKRRREAADRALTEAENRRAEAAKAEEQRAKEYNGPKGPEPTRYGDWERKGIASDF